MGRRRRSPPQIKNGPPSIQPHGWPTSKAWNRPSPGQDDGTDGNVLAGPKQGMVDPGLPKPSGESGDPLPLHVGDHEGHEPEGGMPLFGPWRSSGGTRSRKTRAGPWRTALDDPPNQEG